MSTQRRAAARDRLLCLHLNFFWFEPYGYACSLLYEVQNIL